MKTLIFIFLFVFNIIAYSNTVTVGVLEFAPPFSSVAGGNQYFGFVIDLMEEICKRIKTTCTYKSITLVNQYTALENGAIDVSFLPTPIKTEYSDKFKYSLPYLRSKGLFLTLKENNINTLEDINKIKIGVIKDTLYETLTQSEYGPINEIKYYKKFGDLFTGLTSHDVDVIYVNASVGKYVINNTMHELKPVGDPVVLGEGYAVLALQKNSSLIKSIDEALLSIQADGTYVTIYKRYFSNESSSKHFQ